MSGRQLIFIGLVGVVTFLFAVATGPMVTEALLGGSTVSDASMPDEASALQAPRHPDAAP